MKTVGDEDTVMVMRAGADSEMTSGMSGDHARIIQDKPGIARDAQGPLVSPELLVIVDHPLQRSGTDANVPLRGVTPRAFQVHTNVKIVEGRAFEPGRNEIVAGRAASRQFTNLTIGSTREVGRERVAGGRHLRGGRIGRRVRAVVRREGAAAGLPPRQHLPVEPSCGSPRTIRSISSRTRSRPIRS